MTPFAKKYALKFDKAVDCLIKDREGLRMFFGFPADHWDHLRTTNPIECMFATARHCAIRVKVAVSQDTPRLLVFKLAMAVEVLTAPIGPLPCRRAFDTISPCAPLTRGCGTLLDQVTETSALDQDAATHDKHGDGQFAI